jgi:hypothetical protein
MARFTVPFVKRADACEPVHVWRLDEQMTTEALTPLCGRLRANETEGNFGIVTEFEFRLDFERRPRSAQLPYHPEALL